MYRLINPTKHQIVIIDGKEETILEYDYDNEVVTTNKYRYVWEDFFQFYRRKGYLPVMATLKEPPEINWKDLVHKEILLDDSTVVKFDYCYDHWRPVDFSFRGLSEMPKESIECQRGVEGSPEKLISYLQWYCTNINAFSIHLENKAVRLC